MGSTDVKLISLNTLSSFSHSHHHNSHWHLCIFSLHHHYSTLHIVIVNKMEKNQLLLAFFNTLWSYHIGNTNNQSITKLSNHNLSTTIPIITVKISVKITFSTTTITTIIFILTATNNIHHLETARHLRIFLGTRASCSASGTDRSSLPWILHQNYISAIFNLCKGRVQKPQSWKPSVREVPPSPPLRGTDEIFPKNA